MLATLCYPLPISLLMVYIRSDGTPAWCSHGAASTGSLLYKLMMQSHTGDDDDYDDDDSENDH